MPSRPFRASSGGATERPSLHANSSASLSANTLASALLASMSARSVLVCLANWLRCQVMKVQSLADVEAPAEGCPGRCRAAGAGVSRGELLE